MEQPSMNLKFSSFNSLTPHHPLGFNSDLNDALDCTERTPFSTSLPKEQKLCLSFGPSPPKNQLQQQNFVTPNSRLQAQHEFQQQRLVVDNIWNVIDRDPKLALQKARETARLISGNQVIRFLTKFYSKVGSQEGSQSNDPTVKDDTNKTRAMILWTQLFLKNSKSQQIFSEMMTKLEIALTNEVNFNKKRLIQYIEAPHLTNNKYTFVHESQITDQTPVKDQIKKVTDTRKVRVGSLGITFPQPDNKKTAQFKTNASDQKSNSPSFKQTRAQGKIVNVVDSQGWVSPRGSELLEEDNSEQDEEERKAKERLLRGVIPVEHRDNFDIKRDEKAAFGVASEFQQILQGLSMFGFCVEDLENHIIPKEDKERDQEVQKTASFVKELRIEMKSKGHHNDTDERYSNILKELAEQQLLGEMIPVVKLIDVLRRNGYYGRIETSSQTVLAIENVIKDGRKSKEKLHALELQLQNPDLLNKNANNLQKNAKTQPNKTQNDNKSFLEAKPKSERSKILTDLLNGIEVTKALIIQELQDISNHVDQLENEKERSDHYYKGEIQLLTKQIKDLQNQTGGNKGGDKIQNLTGQDSIYTQAYRFYQKEFEAHGEVKALDSIHDQLLVRIFKEIEPTGDKASIEKLLNQLSNQSPSTLTEANLQIQKLKTYFLTLLAANDPVLAKSLTFAEQQRIKPQSPSSDNSAQYLSDQFVKLAKETKFFKDKYMKEITSSSFHPSQMKQILIEQPYIEYLVTSVRDLGQTNVNLQQIYDFLYEEGYEHIEKIQTWINRKYVKFREPHQVKEAIQVQQIKREATLMQKLNQWKPQMRQNQSLDKDSEESDETSQGKEGSRISHQSTNLNKNSSNQVANENPSNVKSLKLSAIPERMFELQSVPHSNSYRDWDLSKSDLQNLLELSTYFRLPLSEVDFQSAENLSKALNKALGVENLVQNMQNRSPVSLIFDDEDNAKPIVSSKNIKCQYMHLDNLIRDVQKVKEFFAQGGPLSKQEQPISSRNTIIYTARTSSTNEKQIQTKLRESELKLQNEFYELIQPYLQQILDDGQNSTNLIKQSLSSLFDYDVPKIFDERGLNVTIPLFLQKLLSYIKSQLMLINEPLSIDAFLKGLNSEQSKHHTQHDQSSLTRSKYNLLGNNTNQQALPQDCHALIMEFLQDQNDDYKQLLEKHLATLNIDQLETYLSRLLLQSYENDHLTQSNTEYQRVLQRQKLKYTTLQPETFSKENQPLFRPIVPKLNPHNRFSNSSFTTNFSAKFGMASTSRNRKHKTIINIQDMDRNSNNQTTLQKVLGLNSQPSNMDQNSANQQTTYLKPLYNRVRVQTAVPRTTGRSVNFGKLTPVSQCI